jgi:hypothetical protein
MRYFENKIAVTHYYQIINNYILLFKYIFGEFMIKNINSLISIFHLFVFCIFIAGATEANAIECKQDDLYGINWSVNGCSCSADTLSKPKIGAFAEDTLGLSRGWIDARDLICNTKTGKWTAKAAPKFATCSGCKAGYGTNGTCGPATQKSFASAPTSGLCTCGTPSKVRREGSWRWQCSAASNLPSVECHAPANDLEGK